MINRISLAGSFMAVIAAIGVAGCGSAPTADNTAVQNGPSFATAVVINAMRGSGGIGSGTPTFYGKDRQVFSIDVGISGGMAYGTMDYIDSGFVKEDFNYPHFVVGPQWSGTAIATFTPTSATCAEFEGVGYLINTGERLAFRVQACDNGRPGAGVDTFGIEVPQRLITHSNIYRAGPLPLVYGELTASGTATPLGLP